MTEDEARRAVEVLVGPAAAMMLQQLAQLVIEENSRQNLIAQSTVPSIWNRHILDSVQLLRWSTAPDGTWLDIGSGGGFPGLAVATIHPGPMILVEPRRRRADFLREAAAAMRLDNVLVMQQRVEAVEVSKAATISARAVAPVSAVLGLAHHCASADTRWLLPRGLNHAADLQAAEMQWKGVFHVEHSLSDPLAGIIVATDVQRR